MGFLSLWIRILYRQIQNILGSGGQSYAFVFDKSFLHNKGKSALEFIEILSLLTALPLAEPFVKSSPKRTDVAPHLSYHAHSDDLCTCS